MYDHGVLRVDRKRRITTIKGWSGHRHQIETDMHDGVERKKKCMSSPPFPSYLAPVAGFSFSPHLTRHLLTSREMLVVVM